MPAAVPQAMPVLQPSCGRRPIGMGNDAARHHVGAVADARGQVPDRGGRYAEFREVVEPGDAGTVAPDPGIVEDRRGDAELRRQIRGVNAAMRAVDDDRAPGLGADAGDAVGSYDRRRRGGHGITVAPGPVMAA